MKSTGSAASATLSHTLTPAQEAAVLYADGREADAAALLYRALQPDAPDAGAGVWDMLFDLLRSRGDWRSYQALAERFEPMFGTPAPQWVSEDEMARVPEDLRPGGAAYFEFAGALDVNQSASIARVHEAARRLAIVHLDVSRLAALDEAGCAGLCALLRFLPVNGNAVLFTGADYLTDLLRAAVETDPSGDACWTLLLELYRLRGQQQEFERTALEYALAIGATPPVWQPIVMPLAPNTGPQEKRDQPRYQAGPEMVSLTGIMWGAADPQLAGLREFADERDYVNINLAGLKRLDFSCATAFANLVNDMAAAGKTVRLLRPNSLVAAFLTTLNLESGVAMMPARRTA